MTEHVVVEKRDGILHARLNRPEKKNAMTEAMYARLAECFREADSDDEVRVLLLSSEGDSFTSGNDLSTFASVAQMKVDRSARPAVLDLIQAGLESTTPIVAAVEAQMTIAILAALISIRSRLYRAVSAAIASKPVPTWMNPMCTPTSANATGAIQRRPPGSPDRPGAR